MKRQGLVRTNYLARLWAGRLQLDVYRHGGWIAAWNGWRWGVVIGGSREAVQIEATHYLRGASVVIVRRESGIALVWHLDPA